VINLSQIRYYLNYILPDIIKERFYDFIDFLSNSLWWVFLLISIICIFIIIKIYKQMYNLYKEREKFNKFLQKISSIENIKEFEKKLLEFRELFNAKYIAFYLLKGETFVLKTHNLEFNEKDRVAANMYIAKTLIKIKSTSGNFIVSSYISENNDFLLQIYRRSFINLKQYSGYIEIVFSLYKKLLTNNEVSLKIKMSNITKEVLSTVNKSFFSGEGYLKYVISIVKNALGATGIKLYEKNEEIIHIGDCSENLNKKRFFIHNTGYFADIYSDRNFQVDELKRVGSFLDMSGNLLSTLNRDNSTADYYIDFLINANEMYENQNIYFVNHTKKVTEVSMEVGKALFLDREELHFLRLGALLHDIGMIGDLGNLIDKTDDLSKEDMSLIKLHPLIGATLLEPVSNIYPISPIIKFHHEKVDGSGYPFGIAGNEIPQLAQIVALSEFFVGLISDRSYKKGLSFESAKDIIEKSGNKLVDQVIIDAFFDSMGSIEQKFLKIDLELKNQNKNNQTKELKNAP